MGSLSEALSGLHSDRYGEDVTPLVVAVGRLLSATEKAEAAGLPYAAVQFSPATVVVGPYPDGSAIMQRLVTVNIWQDLTANESTPDNAQAVALWHAVRETRTTVDEGEMGDQQIGELVLSGELEPQYDQETQQVFGFVQFTQTFWRA